MGKHNAPRPPLADRFDLQKIINGARFIILALPIWSLSACGGNDSLPYRIIDSGIQTDLGLSSSVWLDENRLLVSGFEPTIIRPGEPPTFPANKALGIWDSKNQDVKMYRSIDADIWCYSPETGKITYTSKGIVDGVWKVVPWHGVLGQENKVDTVDLRRHLAKFGICSLEASVKKDLPGDLNGRDHVLELPENRGFIWPYGRDPREHAAVLFDTWGYFDSFGNELVRFPLNSNDLIFCCQWLAWKKGYFITRERPPDLDSHIGWLLHTSGQLEKIRVPPRTQIDSKHMGPSVRKYMLTKSGIVFHYSTLDDRNGIYLATGDHLIKVANDVLIGSDLKVSPDGCKVVYVAHDNSVTLHEIMEPGGRIIGYTDPRQYTGAGKSIGRTYKRLILRFKVVDLCDPVNAADH